MAPVVSANVRATSSARRRSRCYGIDDAAQGLVLDRIVQNTHDTINVNPRRPLLTAAMHRNGCVPLRLEGANPVRLRRAAHFYAAAPLVPSLTGKADLLACLSWEGL